VAALETWIVGPDGKVFWHVENDGPAVPRRGIKPRDYSQARAPPNQKFFAGGRLPKVFEFSRKESADAGQLCVDPVDLCGDPVEIGADQNG
jgi:hypothetical protein